MGRFLPMTKRALFLATSKRSMLNYNEAVLIDHRWRASSLWASMLRDHLAELDASRSFGS